MNIRGSIPPPKKRTLPLAFVVLAFAASLPAQSADKKADDTLPLPRWTNGQGGSSPALPELSLWPSDFNPDEIVHPAVTLAVPAPEDQFWQRFLPRGLFGGSGQSSSSASTAPLVDMPAEAWSACQRMPGDTRLFDPQGLLAETQAEDMRRLLTFHAERAGVTAAIVLLDARQNLPAEADLTLLGSGDLARKAACIVVYPLGEPDRARVFFTRTVGQAVDSPTYLANLATTCLREAAENPDPGEQLQRFAIQLSIRLFWLERAYPVLQPAPLATVGAAPTPAQQAAAVSAPASPPLTIAPSITPAAPVHVEPLALSEVTPPPAGPPLLTQLMDGISLRKKMLLSWGALAFGVLVLLLGALSLLRWRRRRLRQSVWILPDPAHPTPRFGGPHCGASGASIQYG